MNNLSPGALTDIKDKVITFLIRRAGNLANTKVDIGDLQQRYNADQEKVGEVQLTDLGKSFYFQVKDGEFRYLSNPPEVDGGVQTTSDVLISLAKGTTQRMDPATGEVTTEEYTPIDALIQGHISLWGEAATNDALLAARILYDEVRPDLHQELKNSLATGTNDQ